MNITEMISELLLLLFIAAAAYQDQKEEAVNVVFVIAGGVLETGLNVISGRAGFLYMAEGTLVGLAALVIGYASRQAIGYGDGLMLMSTGIFLGPEKNIEMFVMALLLSSICALLFIILKLKKKNDRIPFIPFMLGGYILTMIVV